MANVTSDQPGPADTNPQAGAPGQVEPQRTPGSAPSVVPLPSGASPRHAPGEHPLPEEAIEGYPNTDDLYEGTGGSADGVAPVPDPPEGASDHGVNANAPERNEPAAEDTSSKTPAKKTASGSASSTK